MIDTRYIKKLPLTDTCLFSWAFSAQLNQKQCYALCCISFAYQIIIKLLTIKNTKTMFQFKKENQDPRAEFANEVCQLMINDCNGDFEKASKKIARFKDVHFEENVRNIYELIDNQIPLFALYDLELNGAANYGFSEGEYKLAIKDTKEACVEFYNCA